MVVLAILGVVMVGVLSLITSQNNAYHSEEAVIDLQMNGRLAISQISRYIRMGGFGCYGNINDNPLEVYKDGTDTIELEAVITAEDGGTQTELTDPDDAKPDKLTVVTAARKVGIVDDGDGTSNESFPSISTIPIIDPADDINDLLNPDVKKGKRYVFIAPCENTNFLTLNAVSSDPATITLTKPIRVDEGAEIYVVKAYTFSIKYPSEYGSPKPPGPNLVVNENTGGSRQDLAENIENIQFQYGLDPDGSGSENPLHFDPTNKDHWKNNPTSSEAKNIKAVRIYVLARSAHEEHPDKYTDRKTYKINDPTASVDHPVIVGPFNDHYHRFLLRTTVSIRNLNYE